MSLASTAQPAKKIKCKHTQSIMSTTKQKHTQKFKKGKETDKQ